ncbi:MAG: 50S ribosomal protein L15 [Bacteroidales bacterium]|nr:50S ribosomal protein L15 [Bacteroidales bacterium]
MDLSNLKPAFGSTHHDKRLGRGEGSGRGGTSTRGHKGAKARSGYKQKFGFEGGQMPLQRRLPKFGFKCPNRVEYKAINISTLQALAEKNNLQEINIQVLRECGVVSKNDLVKILADGELKAKLTVKAHAFSKKAVEAIEAVGGSTEVVKNSKKVETAEN